MGVALYERTELLERTRGGDAAIKDDRSAARSIQPMSRGCVIVSLVKF